MNNNYTSENAQEIWALQQSIKGLNVELDKLNKQSQTLLFLGIIFLVVPFGLLIYFKLDAFTWINGFACGLGILFIQMSISAKRAHIVSKSTKQYVKLDEIEKRLAELNAL